MFKFIISTLYGTAIGFCFMAITVCSVGTDSPNLGPYALIAFLFGFAMPFSLWADKAWKIRRMKEDARLEAELKKLRNA